MSSWTPKEANTIIHRTAIGFDEASFFEGVLKNDYILVVGPEVILNRNKFPESGGNFLTHVQQQILAKRREQMLSGKGMYYGQGSMMYDILKGLNYDDFREDVSTELITLLETRYFKYVFTTTPDLYLEKIMEMIWGRVRIVNITNDTSLNAFRNAIINNPDYCEPTLFYVFGCISKRRYIPGDFVENDEDAIRFIERWIKGLSVKDGCDCIEKFLREKRILGIGCNYDNWYYRFFWYILTRDFVRGPGSGKNPNRADNAVIDANDVNLGEYMNHLNVCIHTDSWGFLSYLCEMLKKKEGDESYADMVNSKKLEGRVFVSYKNDPDQNIACSLVEGLRTKSQFNIWFDKSSILGGQPYNKDIPGAIRFAKVFIPILTPAVAGVLMKYTDDELRKMTVEDEPPYFIKEWLWAKDVEGLPIIPIAFDGYKLNGDEHHKFMTLLFNDRESEIPSAIYMSVPFDQNQFDNLISAINKNLGII